MTNLYILMESLTNGYKSGSLHLISFVSVFFAISVLISKNPIVSVLFLISLFFSVSSYLMILGMHFMALSYLLVYVGAISILFLFILMLINVRISELTTDNYNSISLAIIAGLCFVIPVYSIMPFNLYIFDMFNINILNKLLFNWSIIESNYSSSEQLNKLLDQSAHIMTRTWDGNLSEVSHITSIGNIMYTEVFIWLIVISLILLLAMVGAIVITIKPTKSVTQ